MIGPRRRRATPQSPEDVVRLLVMVNRLRHRYPKGHSRVRNASTEFIGALTEFLRQRDRNAFRITLRDGRLTHDGSSVLRGDEAVQELARLMHKLDCVGLVFRPDLTSSSVAALLDWMAGERERPADGSCPGIEFLGESPMDRAAAVRAPFGLGELDAVFQVATAARLTLDQVFAELRMGYPLDVPQVNLLVRWIADRLGAAGRAIAAPVFLSPSDDSPAGHATHVFLLSMALLHPYARDPRELDEFCVAALLHDIGMASPNATSARPNPDRDPGESARHGEIGADILLRSPGIPPLAVEVAFTHHMNDDATERRSTRTPLQPGPVADAVHVADRIERLTGRTRERKSVPFVEALEMLIEDPGLESKRDVIQAYFADLTPYPPGSLVRVKGGSIGVVLHVYPDTPDRPRIALVQDENGADLGKPAILELLDDGDASHAIVETLPRPPYPLRAER